MIQYNNLGSGKMIDCKEDLIERIISDLEDKELLHFDNYGDYDDAIADIHDVLEKRLSDFLIIQGRFLE